MRRSPELDAWVGILVCFAQLRETEISFTLQYSSNHSSLPLLHQTVGRMKRDDGSCGDLNENGLNVWFPDGGLFRRD